MPRYIEQLNENITPASGDWLWIVDVSAEATDQDRKLSVGKLALLATANTFAEIVTASKGIAFPAIQVHSANAHTLDDYEEGVWTPNQGAGLTVVGAFSSSGRYTKIGRLVTVTGEFIGVTSIAVATNGVFCTNLPFLSAETTAGSAGSSDIDGSQVLASSLTVYATNAIGASGGLFINATYSVT